MNNFQANMLGRILEMHRVTGSTVTRVYYDPSATPGYIDVGVGHSKIYLFKDWVEGVHNGACGSNGTPRKVELWSVPEVLDFCREASKVDSDTAE